MNTEPSYPLNPHVVAAKEPIHIDIKRFYIPDHSIVATCSKCNSEIEHDFGRQYMMYPTLNDVQLVHLYCELCDIMYAVEAKVSIKIKIIKESESACQNSTSPEETAQN